MKKQVTRVSPQQTSKVLAVFYFFASLPFVIYLSISSALSEKHNIGTVVFMLILMPLIYMIFGYLFTLYGAWIYNHIAKRLGGIEVTINEVDDNMAEMPLNKSADTTTP